MRVGQNPAKSIDQVAKPADITGLIPMIRRPETIDFWGGDLPHWEVVDGRYFVTIHLRGAIPQAGFRRIRELAASFRNPPIA